MSSRTPTLTAGDSQVPMLVVGAAEPPAGITGVAPLLLERLGVERASQPLTHVA